MMIPICTGQMMAYDRASRNREGEGTDADLEKAIKLSLDPSFLPQGQPPVGGVAIRDPVSETIPKLPEVVGKALSQGNSEEQAAHFLVDLSKKKSTTDQFILVKRDQAPHDSTTGPSSQPEDDTSEKVVQESSLTTDSERTESGTNASAPKVEKEQGEVTSSTVTSGVVIPVQTEDQAGSDPEKAYEALAGPDPEPMQEDQTRSDSGKEHVSLPGPNPEHMEEDFYATSYPKVHENLKLRPDEHVIEENPESHSGSMSSIKNLEDTDTYGDLFLNDKPTEDDQEKTNVADETKTDTSTPPLTAPIVEISSPKPSSLVTPPPINTEATTITTSLPEITPFIALQLRVARLEQEMSEVKKTDHSADVLASIKSQVPTVVDKYLGTKLDDALLRILERHTADLIEKYSVLPGPESIKNQESEKSPKEIIRIKKEQGEEKQKSTYSIRSTDKVALEEFDLKSALFKHMNKNKTANRNPANYHLYHALMEALIADEDAMDKEVKDRVKNHKRKHDSDDDEDDDDDEGPSAGSKADDEQSLKKPQDSDASASKQHPTLTSTGWQITDTRDAVIDSSMHSSEPESGHSEHSSEHSSDDVSKQDEGHVSDLEDTDNAHIPKNNWANAYATSYQVPAENKLQRKTYDIGSFIKWFCRRTGKKKLCKADLEGPAFNLVKAFHKNSVFLQFQMDECHKLLTNKVDLVNPEGHPILDSGNTFLTGDKERKKIALSISKLKAARYLDFGLEELVPSLWVESERDYDISAAYGITHWWAWRRRKWSEDDQEKEQRIHHQQSRKTTDQEVLSKSGKLVGEHPSETKVLHNEDGNPARANIKQALGSYERPHKGVKAFANSDIVYFFTSAQDGDPLQDDVRLCLGDDLKKAQDHNQRQVKDESKDHYPKCTRYQMSTS
ncbi:hypothetical protein Tco_0948189 [Tanacetum coccineum]